MEKWEYKVIDTDAYGMHFGQQYEDLFNMLGREGWELILNNGGGTLYIFKRKIVSDSNPFSF